jgi:hypothetical protein
MFFKTDCNEATSSGLMFAPLLTGLDGLARSLAYEHQFHWAFNPKTMKEHPGFNYFRSGDS